MTESLSTSSWLARADRSVFDHYLLVIRLDSNLLEKVTAQRAKLYAGLGLQVPANDELFIEVARFAANSCMEETLMRWMQKICCRQKEFLIMLNNFGGNPIEGVRIRIQDQKPFKILLQQLKTLDDFVAEPVSAHDSTGITLLPFPGKLLFQQIMLDHINETFHAVFYAQELHLVKKDPASSKFKTLNVFHFLPAEQFAEKAM